MALHRIRRFRNGWVHVNDPHDDDDLLARPEYHEKQLEEFATFTIEQLRRVIYLVAVRLAKMWRNHAVHRSGVNVFSDG